MIALLVFVEIKIAREPVLPPRLFKDRSKVALMLYTFLLAMSFQSINFHMAIYNQMVRDNSATMSGVRMLPMPLTLSIFSISSGRFIALTGKYKIPLSLGAALVTTCVGLLSILDTDTSWGRKLSYHHRQSHQVMLIMLLLSLEVYGTVAIGGAGFGCIFVGTSIAAQASVEKRDIGNYLYETLLSFGIQAYLCCLAVMLGLNTFIRMVGSTLGLAVADAFLKVGLERRLPLAIPPDYVSDILNSPETIHGSLPVEYIDAAKQAYADSLKDVWHVTSGFVGLGLSPIITRMVIFCIILT